MANGGQTGAAAPDDDRILPFQLDLLDLRGRVVRLDATLHRILTQHAYPPSVSALVGEAALLATLIGSAMKVRHKFSLQARGDGPVSLVAADYLAPPPEDEGGGAAGLRAYAQVDLARMPDDPVKDPSALIGAGLFAMTIDQGPDMRPYQGVTPLVEGSLRLSSEVYFAQSEQVATRFAMALGQAGTPGGGPTGSVWRAGGVMLQHLAEFGEGAARPEEPSSPDGLMRADDIAAMSDGADQWREATLLLDTVEEIELIGPHVTAERLLYRLFHETAPRVYTPQTVEFRCTCAREKVETLLRQYDAATLDEMREDDGRIHADCQFCGIRYSFD